jgi:hypothetical protein
VVHNSLMYCKERSWIWIDISIVSLLDTCQFLPPAYFKIASLAGNVQLEARVILSHLLVTATGPAYFVATCGESLAWIGSALLSNTENLSTYYIPSLTNFRTDSAPSTSTLLNRKTYCDINIEVASLDNNSYCSLPATYNRSSDVIGKKCFIQGFPIRRRPEGYIGLELSYAALLYSLQTEKATILEGQAVIRGGERTLKLVKHTDDVFLWHLLRPLVNDCSCPVECYSKDDFDQIYGALDDQVFEAGRHILSECANDIALVEGMYQVVFTRRSFLLTVCQHRSRQALQELCHSWHKSC